jgi:hypothetical protein
MPNSFHYLPTKGQLLVLIQAASADLLRPLQAGIIQYSGRLLGFFLTYG